MLGANGLTSGQTAAAHVQRQWTGQICPGTKAAQLQTLSSHLPDVNIPIPSGSVEVFDHENLQPGQPAIISETSSGIALMLITTATHNQAYGGQSAGSRQVLQAGGRERARAGGQVEIDYHSMSQRGELTRILMTKLVRLVVQISERFLKCAPRHIL
eukprot:COSAG05_NODE_70_length_22091_cov_108.202164_3_plen_157_part_00